MRKTYKESRDTNVRKGPKAFVKNQFCAVSYVSLKNVKIVFCWVYILCKKKTDNLVFIYTLHIWHLKL